MFVAEPVCPILKPRPDVIGHAKHGPKTAKGKEQHHEHSDWGVRQWFIEKGKPTFNPIKNR
jgi:hypothetical protein